MGFIEIDQEAERQRNQTQVVTRYLLVEVGNVLNRLQFNENKGIYDEVGSESDISQQHSTKVHWDGLLAVNRVASVS